MIASFLNEILKQSFLIIWCECRLIDEKVLKIMVYYMIYF